MNDRPYWSIGELLEFIGRGDDGLVEIEQLAGWGKLPLTGRRYHRPPPAKTVLGVIRGEINLYAGGITDIDPGYDERKGASLCGNEGGFAVMADSAWGEAALES